VGLILTIVVAVVELVLAGAIYTSVAAPKRAPLGLEQMPLVWRLSLLLAWSLVCGVVLQTYGVASGNH
jgi:hypothetical protein